MSLLDPFVVCDAVLQTVMQQDVYVAIRSDNPNSGTGYATPVGSGTAADPYGGPADTGDWFDYVMANLLGAGPVTVRMGPGSFLTKGADGFGNQGWAARDGLRILGSGVAETTLKLVAAPMGQHRHAVGMPSGSTGLNGFEASDFSVDCGFPAMSPASSSGNGAIRVFGTHVCLRRIKATKFGSTNTSSALVVFAFASNNSEDCVMSECIADTVANNSTMNANVILFGALNSTGAPHRFCVIRNCWGQGVPWAGNPPAVLDYHLGISPGLGIGTIIEGNLITNVGSGVWGLTCATTDLVIRDNYLRNVHYGLNWDQQSSSSPVGRIIALSNVIDLSRISTAPYGLRFAGNTGSARFTTLVLRRNILRQIEDAAHSLRTDASGISFLECTNAIVENNVIDDTTNSPTANDAIWFHGVQYPKFFNNQTSAGTLLRGWDNSTYKFQPELEDAARYINLVISGV